MKKKVIVIGAGFSGLSAACFLAKAGYEVTILEKNPETGGRCRLWQQDNYLFDMGPSWYWMPDIFEKFFASFGRKVSDYYTLARLDPSYRVFFDKKEIWDIPATPEAVGDFFEEKESGAKQKLQKFLNEAEYKYNTGMHNLVYKPGLSVTELIDRELIAGFFKLDVFQSISRHIRSLFKNKNIIQLLEFPVLFLGAKPSDTPALYSLMNYADISLGTWYPMGGMVKISGALTSLAKELGVKIELNSEVKKIDCNKRRVQKVLTKDSIFEADFVIAGADYHHVESKLLDEKQRNYTDKYWNKRVMAPSSLIFYLGVNKKIEGLLHHNLFFDRDFVQHAQEIYDSPVWPKNPLFYVCCSSKTDAGVAPENGENIFILVPVAPGLKDTEEVRETLFERIIDRLENLTDCNIRDHISVKRSYAHNDFIADYHSFKGNAYGLANTLKQTAYLKPSLKNKKVENLYYTGQLTVPGPGVPPAIISGEVVAAQLIKDDQQS